jgi:DNA-binding response OmpR family regulator
MVTRETVTINKQSIRNRAALRRILIVAENTISDRLQSQLSESGFSCLISNGTIDEIIAEVAEQIPDVVLIKYDDHLYTDLVHQIKEERPSPVIALVDRDMLGEFKSQPAFDDFVVEPFSVEELALRIRRLAGKTEDAGELLKVGDMVIDMAKCEVSVSGRRVVLTFKEYELLRFLAAKPGRVFTREVLLDKVWGYDYFGGDRTVDVHIRRLRSKIEDPKHTFIETIRSIGYRFRKDI